MFAFYCLFLQDERVCKASHQNAVRAQTSKFWHQEATATGYRILGEKTENVSSGSVPELFPRTHQSTLVVLGSGRGCKLC